MGDSCNPLIISVEQTVSSPDELESAFARLNPILRRLVKEALRLEEAEARQRGGYSKLVIRCGFEKAIH